MMTVARYSAATMWSRRSAPIFLLAFGFLSCSGRTPEPARPTDGLTVEGEGLTAEQKRAFVPAAKQLLTEAVSRAVAEGVDDVVRKLNLADEVERRLLAGVYDWGSPDQDGDIFTVHLLRPGPADRPAETVELSRDGRPVIRFTRVSAPVERPVAAMTRSRVDGGRLTQVDLWLTFGQDGAWHASRSVETKQTLGKP
jgi:hypothetical protein